MGVHVHVSGHVCGGQKSTPGCHSLGIIHLGLFVCLILLLFVLEGEVESGFLFVDLSGLELTM